MLQKFAASVNTHRFSVECSADRRGVAQSRFRAGPALSSDAVQELLGLNPSHRLVVSQDFGGNTAMLTFSTHSLALNKSDSRGSE